MTDYLQSIINAFQDLIFIFDADGVIVDYLSPNHSDDLISPKEVFLNKNYRGVLPPNVANEIDLAFEKIQGGESTARFDYKHEINGKPQWYSAVISAISDTEVKEKRRYLGVVRNITRRVLLEKAVEESEKKYQNIFENVRDVFYRTDKDGVVIDISPSIERYSGYKPEEVIGKPVLDFYYYPIDRSALLDVLQKKGEVIDFEVRLKTKSNHLAYASVNAHILIDEAGNIIGTEGYLRDISERKKAEEELVKKNGELLKLNRQKDKLFSVISHDLKNSISGTSGMYDLILDNYDSLSKDELFKYISILGENAKSQAELLEDLLMWARNQFKSVTVNPRKIKLHEIAESVLLLTGLAASEKNITVDNRIHEDIVILADPDMLKTILRNLVNNAIKFSHEGGAVTLDAEELEDKVKVSVTDRGIGIRKETIKKILNKDINYTSKGTKGEKGSGLGLDLCLDFVDKHNGTVEIKSNPGKGTVIEFMLPKQ